MPIIDAATGMVFIYLLLSLVSSAIREAVEGLLRKRADALRAGVNRLLGDALAQELYRHGLVAPLADHPAGPCYIPPRAFATALQDIAQASENMPDHVGQVLRALEIQAEGDAVRLRAGIEAWFNSAMDALSADYRRNTRVWLAAIGMVVTVGMNADSIRLTGVLFGSTALAASVAQAAQEFAAAAPKDAAGRLSGPSLPIGELPIGGLPIGWTGTTRDSTLPWKEPGNQPLWFNAWLLLRWHWAGWLITVAAITVGAPFWFDLLNQVARFRPPGPPANLP